MDLAQRIVTCTPLTELWNSRDLLNAARVANVSEADIVQLMREGACLVVAEVGLPLRWVSEEDRFAFWKAEVECRLVTPDACGFRLDDYPGNYCYVAAKWMCASSTTVIVLEKHH